MKCVKTIVMGVLMVTVSNLGARSVEQLVQEYHAFQRDFGSFVPKDYTKIIETLFSPQTKKIINGKEAVSKRSDLEKQLTDIRAAVNGWIEIIDIFTIPSADGKSCTFRYLFNAPKVGWFDIIAVLHSSDGDHIDLIDEIYYQPAAGFAPAFACTEKQAKKQRHGKSIEELAHVYIQHYKEYGQSVASDFSDSYKNLFSPAFKGFANGQLLAAKPDGFEKHLADTKEEIGKWLVDVRSCIPSADGKHCTLRYVLTTEKEGKYDVFAVLSSHEGERIDALDGVYYALSA